MSNARELRRAGLLSSFWYRGSRGAVEAGKIPFKVAFNLLTTGKVTEDGQPHLFAALMSVVSGESEGG